MIAPGTKAKITVIREGKKKELEVTIGEQPADFAKMGPGGGTENTPLGKMGLTLQNLTEELASQFGYEVNQGVLVADVAQGSSAAEAGMKAGQLIEEVNKQRVHNLDELQKAIAASDDHTKVLLRVRAGNFSQYIVLRAK
jgi:serine protease Do